MGLLLSLWSHEDFGAQKRYKLSNSFFLFSRIGLRGYVIGHAEHGRSMDMGGAMHAPRCMLRASILSVGGCRDAEHPSRKRVWVALSMESKRKEKSNFGKTMASKGVVSGHNNHSLYRLLII